MLFSNFTQFAPNFVYSMIKNIEYLTSGSERLPDKVCPPTLYAIWNEAKFNVYFDSGTALSQL